MFRKLTVTIFACSLAGPAVAYDIVVDPFDSAVNTLSPVQANFGSTTTASDSGLPDVLGGSRELEVVSDFLLIQAGIIPGGLLNYMSQGTGSATVTYDADGAGFRNQMACGEATIQIDYLAADLSAQGVGTGPVQFVVILNGIEVARPVTAESGTLAFPIAEFAGVDLVNLATIALRIDGTASDSADLSVDAIRVVDCEAPPSPSPAMSPIAMGFGSLVLVGLGWLGVARRRASL